MRVRGEKIKAGELNLTIRMFEELKEEIRELQRQLGAHVASC